MTESVGAETKVVMWLFVESKLKRSDQNHQPIVRQHPRHFRHKPRGIGRVFEDLNVEYGIETPIRKRQCDAIVDEIRPRGSITGGRQCKGRFVLYSKVLGDIRS